MSVHPATFFGMMDNTEADNFRRIQLMSKLERARDVIAQYRRGIDDYRERIDKYYERLGRIAQRLGEPEEGDHDDN
jgi:hypothetical protein